jgi:hypothetical protein
MLARMAREQSGGPQFVRIAEIFGLAAGEVRNPGLGFGGDRRLPAGPRQIIEHRHRAIGQRPLNTTLNGLMIHPQSLPHRKKRWIFPVGHQHPRPLELTRRFRSRARNQTQRRQILLTHRRFDRLSPARHRLHPSPPNQAKRLEAQQRKMNPAYLIGSMESMN